MCVCVFVQFIFLGGRHVALGDYARDNVYFFNKQIAIYVLPSDRSNVFWPNSTASTSRRRLHSCGRVECSFFDAFVQLVERVSSCWVELVKFERRPDTSITTTVFV